MHSSDARGSFISSHLVTPALPKRFSSKSSHHKIRSVWHAVWFFHKHDTASGASCLCIVTVHLRAHTLSPLSWFGNVSAGSLGAVPLTRGPLWLPPSSCCRSRRERGAMFIGRCLARLTHLSGDLLGYVSLRAPLPAMATLALVAGVLAQRSKVLGFGTCKGVLWWLLRAL